mmetsp:Transcript_55915/g.173205  ORF Transcript_55915/g.173205 Transcript_55915/m.173205 type:complete len:467 (-) Transcript_55915:188-1588(-)
MLGISICNGRFEFGKKIGSGSFGAVYYGVDSQRDTEVAIKLETSSCKTPQLEYEAKLYKVLTGGRGFPSMHWYGQESGCNIMVLDLLGPSLQDLHTFVGRQFSLKTVFQLGHKVLDIIEYLHSYSFIHRDIKPANLLVGLGEQNTEVHLVDFGLAKRYWSSKTAKHIPYKQRIARGVIGSARYASINAHNGIELSRRDDIESCAYMFIHFLQGVLPWQNLDPPPESKEQKNMRIGIIKSTLKYEELCHGLPTAFAALLMVATTLEFEEQPDYALYHKMFRNAADREHIDCDGEFDWTQRRKEGEVVEHDEEDDRISCNLSQASMDSSGERSLGMGSWTGSWSDATEPSASSLTSASEMEVSPTLSRPWADAPTSSRATSKATVAQVGPLLRATTKKNNVADPDDSAAVLFKTMQTAGLSGPLWIESMKKLGFTGEEANSSDGGRPDRVSGRRSDPGGTESSTTRSR